VTHVEKRGPGRWRARYTGTDGRERSKTFARKVDADQFLAETATGMARGEWADPKLGRQRVADFYGEWWPSTGNLRPSTRSRDEGLFRVHILPRFGSRRLASVTQPEVVEWVTSLSEKGLSPATVSLCSQRLAKLFGAAVDAGYLAMSPCRRIPLPRIEREEMRFLNAEEVARLADAIDPRYKALVLVGAYGGLRIGEMAGLRRRHVDVLRGIVEVSEIVTEVGGIIRVGPPKTRAARRRVTLPRRVTAELAAHLDTFTAPDADAWVFAGPDGGALRRTHFRSRHWSRAIKATGLSGLRVHDLRHTAVALWISAGANVKDVSIRAGHTSAAFTLDRYGHRYDSADEALARRLDDVFVDSPKAASVVPITSAHGL
jgi:integrase